MRPGLWKSAISPAMIAQVRNVSSPRQSPDGSTVAYVQSFDGRSDLYAVPANGGLPRQLTSDTPISGSNFAWMPDSKSLVYTARGGKLHILPAEGGIPRQLTEGGGSHHSPQVSKDGSRIVFMADRDERIDVAVVDAGGDEWQRRVSRGEDSLLDPAISPDGKQVAYVEHSPYVMAWDESRIVISDLDTRQYRTLVSGTNVSNIQPRWSPDGTRIAFLSDRSGWMNLWLVDINGDNLRQLVEDEAEHGGPAWGPAHTHAWSPDGSRIAYIRNAEAISNIWIVDTSSGATRQVTNDRGVYDHLSWSPDGRQLLCTFSDPRTAPGVYMVSAEDGQRRRVSPPAPGGFEGEQMVYPQHLNWESSGGLQVHGLLYLPEQAQPGKHPLLVRFHGGPTSQSPQSWLPEAQYFVQRGWAVLIPQYRGSTGYGRAFMEALRGEWGRGDFEDNVNGVRAAIEMGMIDQRRVVAWGGSAGGYSVLVCLVNAPDMFKAGVDLYGLTDLTTIGEQTHRLERYYTDTLLGPMWENYQLFLERSPLTYAERIKAPLLIMQGERDTSVPHAQTEALLQKLRKSGGEVEVQIYPGEGHGWRRAATVQDYLERMDRFLVKYVLNR